MNSVRIMLTSLLCSMALALTCFKSEWLEMRVNIGYVFFGAFALLSAALMIASKKRNISLSFRLTTACMITAALYSLALYGFDRIKVVPASIIREGINLTKLPFSTVNAVALAIILGLYAVTGAYEFRKNKKTL